MVKKSVLNNKKGAFGDISNLAIGIASFAIAIVVTMLIIAQGKSQVIITDAVNVSNAATYSAAYNSTVALQGAVGGIPGWVPLIVIAFIGMILLGLVRGFRN